MTSPHRNVHAVLTVTHDDRIFCDACGHAIHPDDSPALVWTRPPVTTHMIDICPASWDLGGGRRWSPVWN